MSLRTKGIDKVAIVLSMIFMFSTYGAVSAHATDKVFTRITLSKPTPMTIYACYLGKSSDGSRVYEIGKDPDRHSDYVGDCYKVKRNGETEWVEDCKKIRIDGKLVEPVY